MGLRNRVREWLGLTDLPSVVMLQVAESHAKTRHIALMAELRALHEKMVDFPLVKAQVEHLDATLRAAHVAQPPTFQAPTLDWDTVTALAARELNIPNPPKEYM